MSTKCITFKPLKAISRYSRFLVTNDTRAAPIDIQEHLQPDSTAPTTSKPKMSTIIESEGQSSDGRPSRPSLITNRAEYNKLWHESRLSLPPFVRIPMAAMTAFGIGMSLGLAHGSQMAGLRFRAEHAHKLPTNTTGWYLYHKSKNYHLAFGGLKEGFKVGAKLTVLSTAMFCAENLFDVYRGTKDMFNTIMASLAISGGFSLWNRFSAAETARTAKKGLKFGLAYGAVQDAVSLLKGRPVGYIEFIRRQLGKSATAEEKQLV